MPKFNLCGVEKHLAKAPRNIVRVDSQTYFRNTYGHLGGDEDLGEDIEFVHKKVVLRRFPDNEEVNDNKYAGFVFTGQAYGRSRLREGIAAYDKLEKVLSDLKVKFEEPEEVNLEDLEDC